MNTGTEAPAAGNGHGRVPAVPLRQDSRPVSRAKAWGSLRVALATVQLFSFQGEQSAMCIYIYIYWGNQYPTLKGSFGDPGG